MGRGSRSEWIELVLDNCQKAFSWCMMHIEENISEYMFIMLENSKKIFINAISSIIGAIFLNEFYLGGGASTGSGGTTLTPTPSPTPTPTPTSTPNGSSVSAVSARPSTPTPTPDPSPGGDFVHYLLPGDPLLRVITLSLFLFILFTVIIASYKGIVE